MRNHIDHLQLQVKSWPNARHLMTMNLPRSVSKLTKVSHDQISSIFSLMLVYDIGNCRTAPSPREDVNAWRILERFLTTDITYPQTEDAFLSYLGDRYTPDDWKDARAALFSGDGDDALALSNLRALMAANIPQGLSVATSVAKDSSVATPASRQGGRSRSRSNFKVRKSVISYVVILKKLCSALSTTKQGNLKTTRKSMTMMMMMRGWGWRGWLEIAPLCNHTVLHICQDHRPNIRWLQRSMIFSRSTKRPPRGLQNDVSLTEPPGPLASSSTECIFLLFIVCLLFNLRSNMLLIASQELLHVILPNTFRTKDFP